MYFFVKQRPELLVPNLYGEPQAVTLHFMVKLMTLFCTFQMCFESSVSCT